ncbi:hypothetical protein GIB67_023100 [Kingdonia uniflora]|uniref:RRM domain-containing protein n=1 Tax=Kingdonia uniflora TaxID=39325 RepID=A0A7J7M5K2_9MAGN|nr:hypothetical protein GIB67_023100 [Kingdonia uniflora]
MMAVSSILTSASSIPLHNIKTSTKPISRTFNIKTSKPHHLFLVISLKFPPSAVVASTTTAFEDWQSEEEEEFDEGEEEELGRRLYVGNLPYAMTASQLTQLFAEAGLVSSVEIVYDRLTDRSRGFAFITMGSVKDAKQAIRMFDGSLVGRRTVKVNFPEVPRGGEKEVMGPRISRSYRGFVESPHKIYAGNLGWNLNSEGLQDAFADQPGLLSAKVIYDRNSGRSKGFGFITFATEEEAMSALNAMNGVDLEGRTLRLNVAENRETTGALQTQETNSEAEAEAKANINGDLLSVPSE